MSAPHKKGESGIAKRLETYGRRINQILNFDDAESFDQLENIQKYNKQIEVFKISLMISFLILIELQFQLR